MTKNQLLEAWREEAEKHYSKSLGLARHESLLDCLCQAIAVALAQGDDVPLSHIGKLKMPLAFLSVQVETWLRIFLNRPYQS